MTGQRLFPVGPLVDKNGQPTNAGREFLAGIEEMSTNMETAGNLDALTGTPTTAELRDKINAIIGALNGG